MIKKTIRHLRLLPAGVKACCGGAILLCAALSPAIADDTFERGSGYQWRLCPAGRLLPIRPGYTDPATNPESIEIRADASRLVDEGVSRFDGDVEVIRGGNSLRAEVVTYDHDNSIFTAEGRTQLWESGLTWSGESAVYDLNSLQTDLHDGNYTLLGGRGRGHAEHIHHDREQDLTLLNGVDYSTCPLSDEAWRISASTIKLDHESDRGSATNAVLRVRNVPVFYFPYVNFPISDKRKSGFLAPTYGNSNDSGFDLRIPYYWNIAPNYDATITPRALSDRGAMLGTEFRYLGPTWRGEFNAEYLPGDNLHQDQDRSLFAYEHKQVFRHWGGLSRLHLLFNDVSDDEYFEDFGRSISVTSQRFLERKLDFRYRGRGTVLYLLAQDYQTVDDTLPPGSGPYRRLPRLFVQHSFPRVLKLQPVFRAETTYFDRDASVTGGRVDLNPSLSYSYIKPYLQLTPTLSIRHTHYFLDDPNRAFDDNESRTVPTATLDGRLFMERTLNLFGKSHLQTFEPRLFYVLTPNTDQAKLPVFDSGLLVTSFQNIFRANRFSGGDRIGDANQVTASITSRLLDTENGREAVSFSLGQTYFFRDRKVILPRQTIIEDSTSELIAEASGNIGDDWRIRGTLQWDPNRPRTEKSAVSLRYRPNLETVVNLSYRLRRARTDVEQTDVSLRLPLLENLAVIGRWNFSLPDERTLEAVAGLEYESCCWGVRVVGRRFLRNSEGSFENGVFMEVQFRGLGGFGTKAGSLLQRGIPGYEDPFE